MGPSQVAPIQRAESTEIISVLFWPSFFWARVETAFRNRRRRSSCESLPALSGGAVRRFRNHRPTVRLRVFARMSCSIWVSAIAFGGRARFCLLVGRLDANLASLDRMASSSPSLSLSSSAFARPITASKTAFSLTPLGRRRRLRYCALPQSMVGRRDEIAPKSLVHRNAGPAGREGMRKAATADQQGAVAHRWPPGLPQDEIISAAYGGAKRDDV